MALDIMDKFFCRTTTCAVCRVFLHYISDDGQAFGQDHLRKRGT